MNKNDIIIDYINKTCTIILNQGKLCIIDLEDYPLISQYKWHAHKSRNTYYVIHSIDKHKQIIMHRLIMNPKSDEEVDHINGDGLDNRKYNLRIVTNHQNSMNREKTRGTSSPYKGVSWDKEKEKWKSYIKINYKVLSLGYFSNEVDAAQIYNAAAKKYFGEYAKLNIIEEI